MEVEHLHLLLQLPGLFHLLNFLCFPAHPHSRFLRRWNLLLSSIAHSAKIKNHTQLMATVAMTILVCTSWQCHFCTAFKAHEPNKNARANENCYHTKFKFKMHKVIHVCWAKKSLPNSFLGSLIIKNICFENWRIPSIIKIMLPSKSSATEVKNTMWLSCPRPLWFADTFHHLSKDFVVSLTNKGEQRINRCHLILSAKTVPNLWSSVGRKCKDLLPLLAVLQVYVLHFWVGHESQMAFICFLALRSSWQKRKMETEI